MGTNPQTIERFALPDGTAFDQTLALLDRLAQLPDHSKGEQYYGMFLSQPLPRDTLNLLSAAMMHLGPRIALHMEHNTLSYAWDKKNSAIHWDEIKSRLQAVRNLLEGESYAGLLHEQNGHHSCFSLDELRHTSCLNFDFDEREYIDESIRYLQQNGHLPKQDCKTDLYAYGRVLMQEGPNRYYMELVRNFPVDDLAFAGPFLDALFKHVNVSSLPRASNMLPLGQLYAVSHDCEAYLSKLFTQPLGHDISVSQETEALVQHAARHQPRANKGFSPFQAALEMVRKQHGMDDEISGSGQELLEPYQIGNVSNIVRLAIAMKKEQHNRGTHPENADFNIIDPTSPALERNILKIRHCFEKPWTKVLLFECVDEKGNQLSHDSIAPSGGISADNLKEVSAGPSLEVNSRRVSLELPDEGVKSLLNHSQYAWRPQHLPEGWQMRYRLCYMRSVNTTPVTDKRPIHIMQDDARIMTNLAALQGFEDVGAHYTLPKKNDNGRFKDTILVDACHLEELYASLDIPPQLKKVRGR